MVLVPITSILKSNMETKMANDISAKVLKLPRLYTDFMLFSKMTISASFVIGILLTE